MIHTTKMKCERQSLQRVTFRLRYIAGFLHLFQNRVTPSACPLVMAPGIKIRGILTHSDKCRRFLDLQRLGRLSEINTGSRLDSHGIIKKVKLIQVHINDLFLRIITFKLDGNHPLDRFLEQTFHHIVNTWRKQLLCQLLRNGTTTTTTFLHQNTSLDNCTKQSLRIDTAMFGKTDIFRCDQRLHQIGR